MQERRINSEIADKLPIKKYDFIFGDVKKNFGLTYSYFTKKFYFKDTLAYYKNLWKASNFEFLYTTTDTVLTCYKFLYKKSDKPGKYDEGVDSFDKGVSPSDQDDFFRLKEKYDYIIDRPKRNIGHMSGLKIFREKYPEYSNLNDSELESRLTMNFDNYKKVKNEFLK